MKMLARNNILVLLVAKMFLGLTFAIHAPVLAQTQKTPSPAAVQKVVDELRKEIQRFDKILKSQPDMAGLERQTIIERRSIARRRLRIREEYLAEQPPKERLTTPLRVKSGTVVGATGRLSGAKVKTMVSTKCDRAAKYTRPEKFTYSFPSPPPYLPLGTKSLVVLMHRIENQFGKHLVECKGKWSRKSITQWNKKRNQIVKALLETERRMFQVASNRYTAAEEKELLTFYSNNFDIRKLKKQNDKLYVKWADAFNAFQALRKSSIARAAGPVNGQSVINAKNLAEDARDAWYKNSRKLAKLKLKKKSGIDRVHNARIQRGVEKFKSVYRKMKFRLHTHKDFLKVSPEVKNLIGEEGLKILNTQNKRRHKVAFRKINKN